MLAPELWPLPRAKDVASSWHNATSLVVVRHPMARLVSIYYQKFVKLARHQTWAPVIKAIIKKFRADPSSGDPEHITPEEMIRYTG